MSRYSAALSSRSNSIPLADQTISRFTSNLPRRSRCLHLGIPHTPVCLLLSSFPVDPLKFHDVDPITVPHINDDPDWVNVSIPASTPVF